MSDQSNTSADNASVTGQASTAAPTAPDFASLDLVDQIKNLNARLTAIETAPAAVASGDFDDAHRAALKRVVKTVFGDDID